MEENLKISEMTPVETVTGTEIIPCVTDEPKKNKSVTISQIYAAYNAVQSVSLSDYASTIKYLSVYYNQLG